MAKIKVLDLAREVGMEDEKLLLKLRRMGVKVKDKKPAEAEKAVSPAAEKIIEKDAEKEIIEKRVKPTVIRRRTHHLEKPEPPVPPPMEVLPVAPPEVIEEKVKEKVAIGGKIPKEGEKPAKRAEPTKEVKGRKGTEKTAEEAVGVAEPKGQEKPVILSEPNGEAAPPQPALPGFPGTPPR